MYNESVVEAPHLLFISNLASNRKKCMYVHYLAPLTLVLAASATAAAPPAAAPPVDVVLTRFLDMGGVRAGGGGERLMREATSSRMSLKWGSLYLVSLGAKLSGSFPPNARIKLLS